jgi:hypothetical protein
MVALALAAPALASTIRRSRDELADTLAPGLDDVAYRRTWNAFPGARRRLREQFPELHARASADSER